MTKTHLMTNTKIYHSWRAMIQRCCYPKHKYFEKYGGAGIIVCDEWHHSFEEFYKWSLLNGYKEGLSIDRINNDLGYNPDNCRWSDWKTQCRNRKTNIFLEYGGEKMCLTDWAIKTGIQYDTLKHRYKIGWPAEKILTHKVTPNGKGN